MYILTYELPDMTTGIATQFYLQFSFSEFWDSPDLKPHVPQMEYCICVLSNVLLCIKCII